MLCCMGYTASQKRKKINTETNVHIWENKKIKSTVKIGHSTSVKNYKNQSNLRKN